MKLRHTVPLGAGETPASFTSRLAAANDLSAREFCLDFNLRFQTVADGDAAAIAKIADLGGVAAPALMADAFVSMDRHRRRWRYRDQSLVRAALRRRRMRACPRCLIDDIATQRQSAPPLAVYGRAIWSIDAIRTCPLHHIALVEIGSAASSQQLHDFVAQTAPALASLDGLAATATWRKPNGLERYVIGRLHGAAQSPFLDGLELHAAIGTAEMIGAVAVFGRRPKMPNMTDGDWWQAGGAGFKIVSTGPPAIGEFLVGLQRDCPYGRLGHEGPQAMYGSLYHWLAFWEADPAYDPVRNVIGHHIRTHLPVGPGDTRFRAAS